MRKKGKVWINRGHEGGGDDHKQGGGGRKLRQEGKPELRILCRRQLVYTHIILTD